MPKVTATGIESALILNWDGWDGDHEWMVFYDCELRPELWTVLTDSHTMPYGPITVEIEMTKLIATVTVHQHMEEIFRKSIKLVVSTGDFI